MTSPRLLPMGDAAWTLELGQAIDPEVNARCHMLARQLSASFTARGVAGVTDIVPTFRSVTVHFDPLQVDAAQIESELLRLAQPASAAAQTERQWRLPVCFGGQHGLDLSTVAQQAGMAEGALIDLLTATPLRVYAMGFMPGFAYMAELPKPLQLPRRATPRTGVAAQTLAIANGMACVYPWQSPGGWHLLGHMPIDLFDLREPDAPALLRAGDEVVFEAVDANHAAQLRTAQRQDPRFRQRFLQVSRA